jgi:pyruvate dehydrogenase E2 component (dihydrolipoamide acetyltransferase)
MATKVVMPKLGLVMKEGLVVLWHREEGEQIEKGEDLLEIESDKVTTLIEAPATGVLRKIIANEGEVIPCGKTVAIIAEDGEEVADLEQIVAETRAVAITREEWERRQSQKPAVEATKSEPEKTEIKVSPAARKLAKEHGINLSSVKGSGPEGRIVREDVLKALDRKEEAEGAAPVSDGGRSGEDIPVGRMRRSIAENMARSAQTVARVVHFAEIDMTRAARYREENREKYKSSGADLSYNAILIKAVALAMKEYPVLNISFQGNTIRRHGDINIGLAVALDEGLLTVSVKNADKKDLAAICKESSALIEKARKGSLQVDDVTGSSITISSLGAFEIDCFTPVINLPEVAIIGVGSLTERPLVRDGGIFIAPMMKLSLSFDHRAVDGAPAARFLQILKHKLEDMSIF